MSKSYNDCLSTRIRCGNSTPAEDALADAAPDLLAALQAMLIMPCRDDAKIRAQAIAALARVAT